MSKHSKFVLSILIVITHELIVLLLQLFLKSALKVSCLPLPKSLHEFKYYVKVI